MSENRASTDAVVAAVESIHTRYDSGTVLALKPQCRKMCTVGDIAQEEVSQVSEAISVKSRRRLPSLEGRDPLSGLIEKLEILERFVAVCSKKPVLAKILEESYVKAIRDATLEIKEILLELTHQCGREMRDSVEELDEIYASLSAFRDSTGDDIRSTVLAAAAGLRPLSEIIDKLVKAGVAMSSADAMAQLAETGRQSTKETLFLSTCQDVSTGRDEDTSLLKLSQSDETILEACRRLKIPEPSSPKESDAVVNKMNEPIVKPNSISCNDYTDQEERANNETVPTCQKGNTLEIENEEHVRSVERRQEVVSPVQMGANEQTKVIPPEVPDQFRCPITLEIMSEPVFLFTQSGRSFEREALEHWLDLHPTVDPLTNEEHGMLLEYAPNRVLKEVIALWCAEHNVSIYECKSPSARPLSGPTPDFPQHLHQDAQQHGGTYTASVSHADNGMSIQSASQALAERERLLEEQGAELERRFPRVGLKVHRLTSHYNEEIRTRAAQGLLKAMEEMEVDEGEPVARAIAEAGGIPLLVVLLAGSAPVREAAAMALCRVARRPRDNRVLIVNARGIAACVRLLQQTTIVPVTDLTRQAAAGILQHVACYSMNFKVAIANAGAIPLLVKILDDITASDDTKADAARCLWSIAVNDHKKIAIANAGAIPLLVNLVDRDQGSVGVREAAAGALQNLAANNSDNKAAIIRAGAVPPLVRLLANSQIETARETAAGALQNLAKHNEDNKSVLIEAGVLPPLIATLSDPSASARSQRTSARAIENLVWSSNEGNRKAVIDAGAIPVLCDKLVDANADIEVRQAVAEALKVLTPTPKLRCKVARALGSTHFLITPSERDVESIIASHLRRGPPTSPFDADHR